MSPRLGALAAGIALVAATVTACSSAEKTVEASTASSTAKSSDIQIEGEASDPVNEIAIAAIDDLQQYWAEQYPALYGKDYEPVAGGFYAVTPSSGELPPCAQTAADIAGNAFYCSTADNVAWDAETLLPDLRDRFGDFVIPIVLAHEWGHAVQARSGFEGKTVTREVQADCFAGAWAAHAVEDGVFDPSEDDLDTALGGFLFLRDEPGTDANDSSAHGSGFDRVNSFRTGFDGGTQACKNYADGNPPIVEIPFRSAADAASGGNAPYEDIVAGVPIDLEDYWSQVFPQLTGKPWVPLQPVQAFDPGSPPTCDGASTAAYLLFYCVPERYIGFDTVDAMPEIYRQGGDFAVATLLATQYGLAALIDAGYDSAAEQTSLRADCMAGAYTASVLLEDRPTSHYHLSPGDLDKAVTALLVFRGGGDVERQGQGSTRVDAYRDGVLNGVSACVAQ